jgi:hypothetical protein
VNITLNGLSRSWDAFSASMNKRKEFQMLEELWTCCSQDERRLNSKRKPHKEEYVEAFATKLKRHGVKKIFDSRNQFKRDMSKAQ